MLKNLNAVNPLGQFDLLDTLTIKGGEVATLSYVLATVATDKAAADVFNDGYVNTSGTAKRVVATTALVSSSRPLFLTDDGISGYGTLLGSVVGGSCGQVSTGGTTLGPATYTGSGKVTLWGNNGFYGVSTDSVDTTASTGLVPSNTTIKTGDPLYYTSAGLLTPTQGSSVSSSPPIGTFVDFETSGSLVRTPFNLANATGARSFSYATFWFNPPTA